MPEECNKFYSSVISAAYDDISVIKRIMVFYHLRKCSNCKKLYNENMVIAKTLHNLPELECSMSVIKKVQEVVGESKQEPATFIFDIYSIFSRISFKGMITSLVAIIIVIIFALFYRQNLQKSEAIKYPQSEIEKANLQAQQALVLIGKVLNSTQAKLKTDVLPAKVAKPLNRSLGVINDLFKSGDKNEKN